jgi:hypothetical protein
MDRTATSTNTFQFLKNNPEFPAMLIKAQLDIGIIAIPFLSKIIHCGNHILNVNKLSIRVCSTNA